MHFSHLYIVMLATALVCTVPATEAQAAPARTTQAPKAATPAQGPGLSRNVETRINAAKLTYTADKQQAVFEGKVHVLRPDFQLWSDRLVVYLKPAPKSAEAEGKPKTGVPEGMAGGDVDRIEAQGTVRMSAEPNRTGSCSKAVYTASDGVLRMEGDPRVSDGDNTVTGEVIRYFTRENRSEVQGGKKRVEAVFSTPEKTGAPR